MPTEQSGWSEPSKDKVDLSEKKQPTLTFGEQLVGFSFNPSADIKVTQAKRLFADAADLLRQDHESRETSQLSSWLYEHAMCEILNAQMNVVKVLTLKY